MYIHAYNTYHSPVPAWLETFTNIEAVGEGNGNNGWVITISRQAVDSIVA